MHNWAAVVTVTGVPRVTEQETMRIVAALGAVVSHDVKADELTLMWRFSNGSPDIGDACRDASAVWRAAVEGIESAVDPVCTDFRVRRALTDAEAQAELRRIFKEGEDCGR